ncbi:MAG: carboxypeptidase regulatory-like domain-containing protein [Elusimicrobia bacterium]|nr:carboxypeptidase regulatory-like domain-containing protein [Elusimicrobiota bacterium]
MKSRRSTFTGGFDKGLTLIEIVVTLLIVSTVFVSFSTIFSSASKSMHFSRARTLASNLAQEKMQIIKQLSYHNILVTTTTLYRTEFDPDLPYDDGYYPVEDIKEGGINYERLTYIQMAQEISGELQFQGATPDTGMKAITVSVIWQQGNEDKIVQVRNVVSNLNLVNANAAVKGNVEIEGTSTDIEGVLLVVAENAGWQDITDSGGDYLINLRPGSYNLTASAAGYFTKTIPFTVTDGQTLPQDIELKAMDKGTIQGEVWINNHLVISAVVASTTPAGMFETFELIELYNPTTYSWTINAGNLEVMYRNKDTGGPADDILLTYTTDTVRSWHYYLIASTSPILYGNQWLTADAIYSDLQAKNTIVNDSDGGIGIRYPGASTYYDRVAWSNSSGADPPSEFVETSALALASGLNAGEQIHRFARPWALWSTLGRCCDSNRNSINLYPWVMDVKNSTTSHRPNCGGLATGAVVTATDGLSLSTTTKLVSGATSDYSTFTLTSVATGTWYVYISSDSYTLQIATAEVTANTVISIPNSVTVPTYPYTSIYASILSQDNTEGYISGSVKNVAGSAINPAVKVSAGFYEEEASASHGGYLMALTPGTYDITANPNNGNSSYVSQTSQSVVVVLGKVTSGVNFTLSQGGKIRGFSTRDGINALPGIAYTAYNENDIAMANEVSGSDGRFLLTDLATGTYSVEPILGSGETSSPASISTTVAIGDDLHIGTFTISNAFGKITGTFKSGGEIIKTGVLVIVTTTTITTPPALSSNTLTGAPYYMTNSYEDGTYSVDVRGSTSTKYEVYAYYFTFSGDTPVINSSATSNVTVTAGQTTPDINLSW